MRDDRIARLRALLDREGVAGRVLAAGDAGEIAAVSAPAETLDALRRLSPEIRSLGFRYVALDLAGYAD